MVGLLEKAGVRVFSIWSFILIPVPGAQQLPVLQPDIARWPNPSLTLIKGTTLGAAPFTFFYPKGAGTNSYQGPNGRVVVDTGEAIGGTMEQQFDAILYLGPASGITYGGQSRSLCADPDYVEMRARRMALMGAEAGFRARCKALLEEPRTTPTPGLEALARRIIEGVGKGEPPLDIMGPGLTQAVQAQRESLAQRFLRSGPLQSLAFAGPAPNGGDLYRAVFANNFSIATVAPPGPDGKINALQLGNLLQTPEQRAATFQASDRNGDGKLDKAEYAALLTARGSANRLDNFSAQLDADGDGLITQKEFETETQ